MPTGEFFNRTLGRQWRLAKGDAARAAAVFGWDDLNHLLGMDVWNASTMTIMLDGQKAPPPAYCSRGANRTRNTDMNTDSEKVKRLIEQGASVVLNDVSSLTPALARTVDEIRRALNGVAAANLYFSQKQRRAFHSHYDRHEVLALQIHGTKTWRIYKGRADAPIEHPRFLNVPQAEYDRQKGALDQEITMEPGDVLYLPRGQFHDALATDGDSLHITFSCFLPNGLNLLQEIMARLIEDPAFRRDLPRADGLVGQAALKAHMDHLAERLARHCGGDAGLNLANAVLKSFPVRTTATFDLPHGADETADGPATGRVKIGGD